MGSSMKWQPHKFRRKRQIEEEEEKGIECYCSNCNSFFLSEEERVWKDSLLPQRKCPKCSSRKTESLSNARESAWVASKGFIP